MSECVCPHVCLGGSLDIGASGVARGLSLSRLLVSLPLKQSVWLRDYACLSYAGTPASLSLCEILFSLEASHRLEVSYSTYHVTILLPTALMSACGPTRRAE